MKTEIRSVKNKGVNGALRRFFKDYGGWIWAIPSLIVIALCTFYPIIQGIIYSFFDLQGYTPVEFVGLENYRVVVGDPLFFKALENTFEYLFWSLVLTYLPPVAMAFMINELRHGKGTFKFLTYLPAMVSTVATAIIWTVLFKPGPNGIANAFLAKFGIEPLLWFEDTRMVIPMIIVSCSWQGLGGAVLMYFATLQTVNGELYEAAIIDGAGVFKRIVNITIPQVKNIILLLFVQQIISVFGIFTQPLTMTGGGPMNESITLLLKSYQYAFNEMNLERALAIGVITSLILIVVTCFYHILDKKFSE